MPQVGENLRMGIVLEWLKAEGDPVTRGEAVAIVESEKAAFEVLAEADGVLLKILCDAGQEADILSVIACLGSEGETIDLDALAALARGAKSGRDAQPVTPSPESHSKPAASTPGRSFLKLSSPTPAPADERPFASPSARRLARELLVDLRQVRGSGPAGRVVRRDILAAALEASGAAPAPKPLTLPAVDLGDRVVP
ncbi:uncharacterized protein METZ01_LOCUS368008, partial [marine metagenome]